MKLETLSSPRGEYAVATGVGQIVKAWRPFPRSNIVHLELSVAHDGAERVTLTTAAESKVEPFATLMAEGMAAFVMANRRQRFRFRIESVRHFGVAADIPYADLEPGDVFSSLRELEPVALDLVG